MRKVFKKVLCILIILGILLTNASLAQQLSEKERVISFYSNTVNVGESVNLSINLNQIEFEQVKITITGTSLVVDQIEEQTSLEVSQKEESKITLLATLPMLDNKVLSFEIQVPEDCQENELNINVTIEDIETSEKVEENAKITVLRNERPDEKPSDDIGQNTGSIPEEEKDNINNKDNMNSFEKEAEQKEMPSLSSSNIKTYTNSSMNFSSSKQVVADTSTIYQGSFSNYLSNLYVEGYEFTENFVTTKTNYFLEVGEDVQSLNVYYSTYEDGEIVKITGNENLKTGDNKILISVTAENGQVRMYKIYVTKK